MAWELYEQSLCSGCGQDKRRSMNPDMSGWYDVHALQCFSCEALEGHRKRSKEVDLSLKEFVIDTRPPDDIPRPWHPKFPSPDQEVIDDA